MALPRVLVIDDELGAATERRNRQRENFCLTTGLCDVTGDVAAEDVPGPIAEAEFVRGQTVQPGYVENDLQGALDFIRSRWQQAPRWSLVLLDMHFRTGRTVNGVPEGRADDRMPEYYFGLKLLEKIGDDTMLNDLPIVVLSSMDRNRIEKNLSELGAIDFRDKSLLTRESMRGLLEEHGLLEDNVIVGRSVTMLKCLRTARRRSKLGNDNVLVLGETGTGKELLARYIHRESGRKGQYVPLFTQGVPETLIEDRLFGHVKGAYAGADKSAPGAAELAHHGTLFIDEFGDMPMVVQTKLLRLLDKHIRESQRLGATEAKRLDLLVVMATSQSGLMTDGTMRADLMFRAHLEDALQIPPLRERKDDIPILAMHFLRKYEDRFTAETRTISDEAMGRLCVHHWPGNVRELERTIEQAVFNYRGLRVVSSSHLNLDVPASLTPQPTPRRGAPPTPKDSGSLRGTNDKPPSEAGSLLGLWGAMETMRTEDLSATELSSALGTLQDRYADLALRLFKAALLATSRSSVENPEGQVFIHPAMKLLTGDASLTASKAADLIKKLFAASPEISSSALRDPVLREAHETALRLRPRHSRKGGSRSSS